MRFRKFLKNGGGEVLSFMITVPALIYMFAAILGIIQTGMIKERLEYTAYKACREAIVCKNLTVARKKAKEVAEDDFLKASRQGGLKYKKVDAELDIISKGAQTNTGKSSKKSDNSKWMKGNYVQCTVKVESEPIFAFMKKERSSSIVMMIEYPASEGDSYPWFRDL